MKNIFNKEFIKKFKTILLAIFYLVIALFCSSYIFFMDYEKVKIVSPLVLSILVWVNLIYSFYWYYWFFRTTKFLYIGFDFTSKPVYDDGKVYIRTLIGFLGFKKSKYGKAIVLLILLFQIVLLFGSGAKIRWDEVIEKSKQQKTIH